MISRALLEDLFIKCEEALQRSGREFRVKKGSPASQSEITLVEEQLGFLLPPSFTEFLTVFNGLILSSPSTQRGIYEEALQIPNTKELVDQSIVLQLLLGDKYENEGRQVDFPFYILCANLLDGEIVLRMTPRHAKRRLEAMAYWRDTWIADYNWLNVASTFEEWLLRSLRYMADGNQTFDYFIPSQ